MRLLVGLALVVATVSLATALILVPRELWRFRRPDLRCIGHHALSRTHGGPLAGRVEYTCSSCDTVIVRIHQQWPPWCSASEGCACGWPHCQPLGGLRRLPRALLEGARRLSWRTLDQPPYRPSSSSERLNEYAKPAGTMDLPALVEALLGQPGDAVLAPGTRHRWLNLVTKATRDRRARVILRFQVGRRGHLVAVYRAEANAGAPPSPGVEAEDWVGYRYRIERLMCVKKRRGERLDTLPEQLRHELVLTVLYPGRSRWNEVVHAVDEAMSKLPGGDYGQPRYPRASWG